MKIIECPRDAMQGIHEFIPTEKKVDYINSLLKVGFDTIDFGSFVSPKAIPQMKDTAEVLSNLDLSTTKSKLLAIIANVRGAADAVKYKEISCLGYPFSISETFQKRNTNSTIQESLANVEEIQELCIRNNKELVIYISMAFGNPYGDVWNTEIVFNWVDKLAKLGIKTISLADTVGVSNPSNISVLFSDIIPRFNKIEIGAHLHTSPGTWEEKIEAAFNCGCKRFDSALKGYGGCPMAKDDLVGNMATENLVTWLEKKGIETGLDKMLFNSSLEMVNEIFTN